MSDDTTDTPLLKGVWDNAILVFYICGAIGLALILLAKIAQSVPTGDKEETGRFQMISVSVPRDGFISPVQVMRIDTRTGQTWRWDNAQWWEVSNSQVTKGSTLWENLKGVSRPKATN